MIKEAQKITPKDGDTVVFTLKQKITQREYGELLDALHTLFSERYPNANMIVVPYDIDVKIIEGEELNNGREDI